VPQGTPLRVALARDLRVRKVGEAVTAKLLRPVYAYDRIVIPAGSEVQGKIIGLKSPTRGKRTLYWLNADFSPHRSVGIEFDKLILKGGRQIYIETDVAPGIPETVRLVSEGSQAKQSALHNAEKQTREQIHAAVQEVKAPGKMHRLKQMAMNELPYHPQILSQGTTFDAELTKPLDFGSETLAPEELSDLGMAPPPGSVVYARLLTPLDSATDKRDMPVEAVLTQPLFSASKKLLLPQGSMLHGSVIEVQPAGKMHHNGELRVSFRSLGLPEGSTREVYGSLQGLDVARGTNLKLDSEGGAAVTNPKTRYLATALSLAAASTSIAGDKEHGLNRAGSDGGQRTVSGGAGLRAVGAVLGATVQSRTFASALGFYGAGMSVYYHFFTHGRDVYLPKHTPMEIGFGKPHQEAAPPPQGSTQAATPPGAPTRHASGPRSNT
jgi:hypothetical protein